MPNEEKDLELEKLKGDPNMWMRLTTPLDGSNVLGNVFKDKENPFEKDGKNAWKKIQKLAAQGKLYVREKGRSRHFREVKLEGDKLKLGKQQEMKYSNRNTDPILGALMWMSRGYFKWLGLDGISNWFDKRLKQREAINKLQEQYKVEYKALTSEEKAELKALRKHEENLKKLDEAKELSNATKKNLDAIRGKETTETLEELEAMLAKADQRASDNRSPEKEFARRALLNHEENLQKVGEARKNANEKKKTLDAIRGKETTETLEQLEQMLSNANRIEQRRGGPLSANERKARKALRDYVKSLRELKKTENKAEGTKKKLDETLGRETTETLEQLKEMLSISPEEVNERRAIRRHVENLRKLAKAENKAEVTKQKLDEFRSKNNPKGPKEVDSPLSKAPNTEDKTNTMQPTHLGDNPVQNQAPTTTQQAPTTTQQQIPIPPQQQASLVQPPQIPPIPQNPNQFAVQQVTQQEIPGTKKEENEQGENRKNNKITINGVELTDETINQFPPHVVEAFRVIQQTLLEQEAAQRANQQEQAPAQPEANQEEQTLTDVEQQANLQGVDDLEMNQNGPVMNTNQVEDVFQPVNIPNLEEPEMTQEELERMFEGTDAPTMDGALPGHEIDAPLVHGADLEPEKVNVQERPKDQAQTALQERLAAEKKAMDSVVNWKDRLVNTLFSHEEGSTLREYYDMIKDQQAGSDFLAGTVCGLLSAGGDPESAKQIMEGLVSGKPLGSEYDNRINEGVTAYNHAAEQMGLGNREPMTKLIADAALELGRQASQEAGLSPRHVMIGRMISNAMSLADRHALRLKFDDDQWATIRGAFQMSKLAQKHHDAKQLLGKENVDMTSKEVRNAVRDLLLGNAVETMIRIDQTYGEEITNTQWLMGRGYMTADNLTKMMNKTTIQKSITNEQVKNIMEMPNSYTSAKIAKQLGDELVDIASDGYDSYEKNKQIDMQKENKPENEQQLESVQLTQPV